MIVDNITVNLNEHERDMHESLLAKYPYLNRAGVLKYLLYKACGEKFTPVNKKGLQPSKWTQHVRTLGIGDITEISLKDLGNQSAQSFIADARRNGRSISINKNPHSIVIQRKS